MELRSFGPSNKSKSKQKTPPTNSGGFRGGDGGDASPPTNLKVTILAKKPASISNNTAPFRDASPPPA